MLTLKQEKFCLTFIESGNASFAYRRAGYSSSMCDKSVNEAAARLLKNSKVIARIAELRKPAVEAARVTLEQHLNDLKSLRDKAERDGKYGPAIHAEVARGKASGFYVDRIEKGKPGDFERLEDDELERRITESAAALRLAEGAIGAASASARKAAKAKKAILKS